MTPQELKYGILQLAMQGKLVAQHPDEGTGADFLLKIQAEKQTLIKAGKIKKEKPLSQIAEDEPPFDIPESWTWCRLAEMGQLKNGYSFKSTEYVPDGIQVVRISDLGEDYVDLTNAVFYPMQEGLVPYIIENNSFLICMTGSIGKMAWVRDNKIRYLNQRVGMFVPLPSCCHAYLWHFLHSAHVLYGWIKAKTSTNGNIKSSDITDLLVPLPPLAEQKRIVAKLEEILPLINRYEAAWNKLEAFNKRFPVDMQKSILQLAIQGKLVEQRPEEGTGEELFKQIQAEKQSLIKAGRIKKEKPLLEIAEEEIPFEIPTSWQWVKIGALLHKLVDGTHRTPKYTTSGIPFVSVRNMSNGILSLEDTKFISEEEHRDLWGRCNPQRNDILLSKVGTTGVPAKVDTDIEFSLFVSVALLKFNCELIDIDFLYYSILAPDFQKQCREHTRGVGNKNWVIQDIANTIMPLPPLAEQKRIVAKLEEILPLCERLK